MFVSRKICVGHAAYIGKDEKYTQNFVEEMKGRHHMENLDFGRKIILKWILKKYDGEIWIGLVLLRIGTCNRLLLIWY
jgi:hypothetical protein